MVEPVVDAAPERNAGVSRGTPMPAKPVAS
jgi:hypothetical protein